MRLWSLEKGDNSVQFDYEFEIQEVTIVYK